MRFGPDVFEIAAKTKKIVPIYSLLWGAAILAPLLAMVAACIPTMVAVTQDPAVTLREE